jgi:hypothetical protein
MNKEELIHSGRSLFIQEEAYSFRKKLIHSADLQLRQLIATGMLTATAINITLNFLFQP